MAHRLPPLNMLRAFEAAARLGSFVRAADELAVTPAAISQQVRQLEEHLGVGLFRRLPRGLILTDAGRAVWPDLDRGFQHLARGVEQAASASLRGPLVVTAIPSFAARWLMPRIGGFLDAYPEIELTLSADVRVVDFARESIDLGIRYGAAKQPGLDVSLLATEEVFPVCAPGLLRDTGLPASLADLRRYRLLHDQVVSGEPAQVWSLWLRDAGITDLDGFQGVTFSDAAMLTEAAVRGMGVALARTALVIDELATGRLVRALPLSRPADRAYWIVTPAGHRANPRVAAFIAWLEVEAAPLRQGLPALLTGQDARLP